MTLTRRIILKYSNRYSQIFFYAEIRSEFNELTCSRLEKCIDAQELEEMKASGKARNIGVSNFNISQLDRVLAVSRPVCLQVEVHALCQQKELNISVFGWELRAAEMAELSALDRGEDGRICDFSFFKGVEKHPEFPFNK